MPAAENPTASETSMQTARTFLPTPAPDLYSFLRHNQLFSSHNSDGMVPWSPGFVLGLSFLLQCEWEEEEEHA